jgi:hypothetical protein
MKTAAFVLAAALIAGPAAAQSAASRCLSVETTPIAEIARNPQARAALERVLPKIAGFYDTVGGLTLAELMPMTQGELDDAKMKQIQAAFDRLNPASCRR